MSVLAPISDPGFEARFDRVRRHARRELRLRSGECARFLAWFEAERPDHPDLLDAYTAYRYEREDDL